MVKKIKSYYQTVQGMTDAEVRGALTAAHNQDNKIFQLYKTFNCMTMWDVYDVYNELVGPILPSSVGRSLNTLINANAIISIGTVAGENGRPVNLYRLTNNPPASIQTKYNKKVPTEVKVKLIYNTEGTLDYHKIFESLDSKLQKFEETFLNN